MSQAEELLNSMSEEIPVHSHPVPDTDTYFVIDPITRKIDNTNRKKNVIMQHDHNSERFTFELPRYIDGHDMLECTSVTVNVDNIEVAEFNEGEEIESRVNSDAPDITDLRTHPSDPEKVVCSWLISRNSTQLAGILSFHVEFKCVDSNGNVVYEWSTDDYEEIEVRARKKNGEAVVSKHADLLEQWRTRIFGAGDSVMANIAAEGEAQVAAVKAESETQQEAVELKGAQTLDSIPEDYTEVDAMADEAVRSKGDAIVCEVAGESIVLKDSSNDHIRGLKLFGKSKQVTTTGKNLFDEQPRFGAYDDSTGEFTEKSHMLCSVNPIVVVGGTRYYNCNDNTYPLYFFFYDSAGTFLSPRYAVGSGEYITAPTGAATMHVNISSSYGKVYNNDICIATDKILYEPYTGGKPAPNPEYPQEIVSVANPTVRVYGKNLIPYPYPFSSPKTAAGVTFTVNEDGGISMSGTPTAYTGVQLCNKLVWNSDMAIALLGTYTNAVMDVNVFDVDGSSLAGYVSVKELILYKADFPRDFGVSIAIKRNVNDIEMTGTAYPIVIAGDILPTEYEPYKVPQALTVPNTLPGIPVTSGGNYTDSDGQQWICDEIDLERGVYVQRFKTQTCTGADTEMWDYITSNGVQNTGVFRLTLSDIKTNRESTGRATLCNRYKHATTLPISNREYWGNSTYFGPKQVAFRNDDYTDVDSWKTYIASNPIEILYQLATPIETPLTAEEITAFKALRTNYPNTTILNDAGAWMSVKYNADTKTYVDKLKAIRLVDSSTGVICELKIVDGVLVVEAVK